MLPEQTEHSDYEDIAQDNDSLFGSPPPSPSARGRSPSPVLALPSTPSAVSQYLSFCSAAQNVGTIALPGSHSHSEPPVNPIAPSLSLPGGSCAPFLPQSLPSCPSHSRQGSIGRSEPPSLATVTNRSQSQTAPVQPQTLPQQTRRSAPKRKSKSLTPRPPPPPIPLPDPSQPLPAHFLRSQQALLGHAGLIAGIKPSKLATLAGSSRGTSPSNPIVLEDNEGCLPSENSSTIGRSYVDYFKNFDRSKLPTPTVQEVADMLIKQKDIFPVLQSILKLLAAGSIGEQQSPTGKRGWISRPVQGHPPSQPPVKRRKLSRVPAGAADWDVPYPFMDGEGPEAYRKNWLKERGRQLISQVTSLVKIAMDKAAAKKHVEELERQKEQENKEDQTVAVLGSQFQGGKGANHYRMETTGVNLPPSATISLQTPTYPSVASSTTNTDNTTFNDIISALLSASDSPNAASSDNTAQPATTLDTFTAPHPTDDILSTFNLSSNNETVDQSLIDSWLNILQTFPQQTEGSSTNTKLSFDEATLDSLFGIDTPSSFSSPSGHQSSFSTTPNPGAQQLLTSDLSNVGGLDMALNLAAGASNSNAVSTDFALKLSPVSQPHTIQNSTQTFPAVTTDVSMDVCEHYVDGSQLNQSDNAASNSLSPPMNIGDLIDPQLPNVSLPNSAGETSRATNTTKEMQAAPRASSTFLPSPASSFEPATPSSAGWDTSFPEVIIGDQSQAQGTWWDGFMASIAATDSAGTQEIGRQLLAPDAGVAIEPREDSTGASGSGSKATQPKSISRQPRPQPPAPRGHASASTSVAAPTTSQPVDVFSVLRVQDWQPQRSGRKPKKTEVLKKAEERRAELQTRLEAVKVKLWEATIEHGALLQLMRLSGTEQRTSSSSSGS